MAVTESLLGTFKDGGEVPIEGFFNPDTTSGQDRIANTSLDAGLAEEYTIDFPTTPAWGLDFWEGVVTGFKVGDVDVDGTVNFGATIKVASQF